MRVVSGQYRGKAIATPPGDTTRPTSDRARQAVFNILEHAAWAPELRGARVIDLFAGSGALGLEAMSRGAAFCLFVETDDAARGAIRENMEAFGLFGQAGCTGATPPTWARPGSIGAPFDIAFLDPPYAKGLGEKALDACSPATGWRPARS
jgi:16S rRNA (guanine966-N2)-methyltransferase